MRRILVLAVVSLAVLFSTEARAQFIGYTSPQGIQQQLATNVNCTGAQQLFTLQNLGQSEHFINAIAFNPMQFMNIWLIGIDSSGNSNQISDTLSLASTFFDLRGSIFSSAVYPQYKVSVTCFPLTSTFSLNYNGTWGGIDPASSGGLYSQYQVDRSIFDGISANVNHSFNILGPTTGRSDGTLYAKYNVASAAGGFIEVGCSASGLQGVGNFVVASFSLANTTNIQTFQVPGMACPYLTVLYRNSGAAGTLSVEYFFNKSGYPSRVDPCQSNAVPKSSAVITAPATSTTEIVALSGNTSIYVCGFHGAHTAVGALAWEYGTGVACATGTTALTGVETLDTNDPVSYGPGSTIFMAPPGNALCVVTSVAGAFRGVVTYVQQ